MYKCKYFKDEEFLPPYFKGDISVMDERILMVSDTIREILNVKCIINGKIGLKMFSYCGYRPPESTVGSANSYHKKGMAVDIHPINLPVEKARKILIDSINSKEICDKYPALNLIGGIELDVNWIHVDVRKRVNNKVVYFNK